MIYSYPPSQRHTTSVSLFFLFFYFSLDSIVVVFVSSCLLLSVNADNKNNLFMIFVRSCYLNFMKFSLNVTYWVSTIDLLGPGHTIRNKWDMMTERGGATKLDPPSPTIVVVVLAPVIGWQGTILCLVGREGNCVNDPSWLMLKIIQSQLLSPLIFWPHICSKWTMHAKYRWTRYIQYRDVNQ